jgi:hypothetical protein
MSPRGNIPRYLHHPRKFREAGDELPIFEGIFFSPRFAGERKVDRFGWMLASTGHFLVVGHRRPHLRERDQPHDIVLIKRYGANAGVLPNRPRRFFREDRAATRAMRS